MVKNITGEIKKHITGHDESWYSRVWEAGQVLPTSAVTTDIPTSDVHWETCNILTF